MRRRTVTIDLVKLIRLTIDQVHGSDERIQLLEFLHRNTEERQPVRVRLADVLVPDGGDDAS